MALSTLRPLPRHASVRPETLNVAPELLGLPLATPARRAAAIAVDFAVLALLSASGASWIAAALAVTVFQLRRRQPAQGLRRNAWLWLALAVLVFVSLQQVASAVGHWIDARTPATHTAASGGAGPATADEEDDEGDEARAALATAQAASAPAGTPPPANASTAQAGEAGASAARAAPGSMPAQAVLAARVAHLEAELAQARKPAAQRWREDLLKRLHRFGVGFGWAAFYFTLLPVAWQGRTVGKRLLGLRIVELTGRPLTLQTCFGRYGGYAAAMATGGVGFAQMLWDANRQAIQDKIAHTVVVDARARRADAPQVAVPLAAAPEEAA